MHKSSLEFIISGGDKLACGCVWFWLFFSVFCVVWLRLFFALFGFCLMASLACRLRFIAHMKPGCKVDPVPQRILLHLVSLTNVVKRSGESLMALEGKNATRCTFTPAINDCPAPWMTGELPPTCDANSERWCGQLQPS